MNRGHSGDSLDTGFDGIKRSSSDSTLSSDFTSDDEASEGIFINRQPKSVSEQLNEHSINGYPIQTKKGDQASGSCFRSLANSKSNYNPHPMNDFKYFAAHGSKRCSRPIQQSSNSSTNVDADSCLDLMQTMKWATGPIRNTYFDELGGIQQAFTDNIDTWDTDHLIAENGENIDVLSDEERVNLLIQRAVSPTPSIPISNRRMNNGTARMCSRLLECRDLIEAIEFVEQNRDIITSLTRIITHEAPAFRNYDINSYQIDYSVKESFNPNFWSDREPIITTADGNCQYHAVSLSLTGSETYTPEVRLATAVAVIDNREWFDSMLKLVDRGSVLDLVHTIARSYSWGDETTLKAIAVAIGRRIFLYTCNIGKKDYEMVKLLSKEELQDAFREKKFRGGTGIHAYADPLVRVNANNYIMLFHKSEHFIAVLPTCQQLTMFEPYNPIVPVFN